MIWRFPKELNYLIGEFYPNIGLELISEAIDLGKWSDVQDIAHQFPTFNCNLDVIFENVERSDFFSHDCHMMNHDDQITKIKNALQYLPLNVSSRTIAHVVKNGCCHIIELLAIHNLIRPNDILVAMFHMLFTLETFDHLFKLGYLDVRRMRYTLVTLLNKETTSTTIVEKSNYQMLAKWINERHGEKIPLKRKRGS